MTRRATAVVELTAVHRFRDPDYAALTLRMREPASKDAARAVAAELDERGLIHRVVDQVQAREVMVEAYFRWATEPPPRRAGDEHERGSGRDQRSHPAAPRRPRPPHVWAASRSVRGSSDSSRATSCRPAATTGTRMSRTAPSGPSTASPRTGLELVSVGDSGDTRTVSHDYAAEHVHLAYASTVHGIQGETTDASVVGPGVDAAGCMSG